MAIKDGQLKLIVEAAIMAAGEPLSIEKMLSLFEEEKEPPTREAVREAIEEIEKDCEGRGVELKKVSSGYRFQAKKDFSDWVSRLWEERPARYSRALLETLVLIAYKQPITRGEIEHVRGVAVSTNIIKTLIEREWVKVVGHRDVPGKPALYATTRAFLDYFNLTSLEQLPTLSEIRDLDKITAELDLQDPNAELPAAEEETAEQQIIDQSEADAVEADATEEEIDSNIEDRDDISLGHSTSPVENEDTVSDDEQVAADVAAQAETVMDESTVDDTAVDDSANDKTAVDEAMAGETVSEDDAAEQEFVADEDEEAMVAEENLETVVVSNDDITDFTEEEDLDSKFAR